MFKLRQLLSGSRQGRNDINRVITLLWLLILIGLLSLAFPATVKILQNDWAGALTTIGSGLFLAGAATLVGSIIGFLFGVPKNNNETDGNKETSPSYQQTLYQPNTNLEQISDWLTKIIVGVGLVEINKIIAFFKFIGDYCGPAFSNHPAGEIIAISICLHYTLVGFVQGFLLAYLWLPSAFARARKNAEEIMKDKEKDQ
ncbi:hypothetical protein [Mucilaginibacter aquaedulcis]|uniref:hypothetical protein n=1 Tax=Mucilaginibacter aquaedulcis TaxID=1187081 RepID=UPI0025B4A6E2|nr:hypothetical protein [Mucilaginibacter aquaedulcis]MDN3547185.1 hypothetical protein [Mucilaginibacter aquaedulcis]